MVKNITFQLDINAAGNEILQKKMLPLVQRSGAAIAARAASMASQITSQTPPKFTTSSAVGTIKRGRRAIATISADYGNKREEYVARQALAKAKDAGKVN